MLLPKELGIEDDVAVGWFAELETRSGITVGRDTNISSYVKMITGTHDLDDPEFTADFRPIQMDVLDRHRSYYTAGRSDWRWFCCRRRRSGDKGYPSL